MGFLDDLKGKAEDFGEKAKEGFETAKDKAADLIDDVKDRFDNDDDKTSEDKVEEALNYDPGAVETASEEGIAEAAAGVEPTLEPASDSMADPTTSPASESLAASESFAAAESEPLSAPMSEPLTTSEPAGVSEPAEESEPLETSESVGAADAFGGPASDPLTESASESTEPPTTPGLRYRRFIPTRSRPACVAINDRSGQRVRARLVL